MDSLREGSVGAGDASVVAFDGVVGDNLEVLALHELHGLVVLQQSSADLWALGVEHDGASLVGALLQGFTQVGN